MARDEAVRQVADRRVADRQARNVAETWQARGAAVTRDEVAPVHGETLGRDAAVARDEAGQQVADRRASADLGRSGRSIPGSRKQESGSRLREVFAHARRLWREFTGESAYERYVERHRREHPDHEPMTERQFWRSRADFDEANVSTGCC